MLSTLCSIALLAGGDSAHFHLTSTDKDIKPTAMVEEVVLNKCPNEVLEIQYATCKNISGRDELTKVCYVSTNLGYFFVMRDMMDGVNVVFNRWD